jgi:hypothetical protein
VLSNLIFSDNIDELSQTLSNYELDARLKSGDI